MMLVHYRKNIFLSKLKHVLHKEKSLNLLKKNKTI